MQNETCEGQIREEKHLILASAVNNIGAINDRLQILMDRITNADCKPENAEVAKQCEPSFSQVLEDSPNEINRQVNAAHQKIDELTQLIF